MEAENKLVSSGRLQVRTLGGERRFFQNVSSISYFGWLFLLIVLASSFSSRRHSLELDKSCGLSTFVVSVLWRPHKSPPRKDSPEVEVQLSPFRLDLIDLNSDFPDLTLCRCGCEAVLARSQDLPRHVCHISHQSVSGGHGKHCEFK